MMDAAKDKRDMETKHSTIQQKVKINIHFLFLSLSLSDHLYSITIIKVRCDFFYFFIYFFLLFAAVVAFLPLLFVSYFQ